MTGSSERIKHVIEANIRRAKIRPAVFPLALRGVSNGEIRDLLNLPYEAVKNAVNNMRRRGEDEGLLQLPRPTPQSILERRRRTILVNNGYNTPAQLYSLEFAKSLIREGFVGPDLTNWNELHELYRGHNRILPPDFTDRLRLEIFLAARIALLESNKVEPLQRYIELGTQLNDVWFNASLARHEDFIASRITKARWGYDQDEQGFFNASEYGRLRPLILDGGFVDNSMLAAERERSRLGK